MTRPSLFLAALIALSVSAADKTATPETPRPPHGLDMDYGPVLSYSLLKPGAGALPAKKKDAPKEPKPEVQPLPWKDGELIAARGITVKLADNAAVCFDSDTMRYAAG